MNAQDQTAVLVGAGQWMQRDTDPREALDPLSILETVARRAAEDSGAGARLLARVDRIAVPAILSWRIRNPARLLAERLGCRARRQLRSTIGGHMPQLLVNQMAASIARGESRVALLAGGEAQYSVARARRAGIELDWPTSSQPERTIVGDRRPGASEPEMAHGLSLPAFVYPVFENAFRARRGWSLEEHRERLGKLCARFTEVAAGNPYAWLPKQRAPDEITRVSAENRMIAFPYTKFMNSMFDVDQGAALIMTSLATARELGVAEDRLVYWWGGGDAVEEPWFPSERARLDASPALARAAGAALASAGISIEAIDLFDFYSCFPCAVEFACDALGIREDDSRPLTVTGGLPYAGGPWNNYSTHAIATMMQRLRCEPGAKGLVTGIGWYFTRHSAGVYASVPREGRAAEPAPRGNDGASPARLALDAQGSGKLETYTVLYARDGTPERGIVLGRLDDGRRFLANTPEDPRILEELVGSEAIGRRGRVAPDAPVNRFLPD